MNQRSINIGLLVIRVTFGLIVAAHGMGKLSPPLYASLVHKNGVILGHCAIAGELGGGLGIAFGCLTRIAGLGMAAVMWFIAFHLNGSSIHAIGGGDGGAFEYPFLLGVVGVAVAITGAGGYSLDARIFGRK